MFHECTRAPERMKYGPPAALGDDAVTQHRSYRRLRPELTGLTRLHPVDRYPAKIHYGSEPVSAKPANPEPIIGDHVTGGEARRWRLAYLYVTKPPPMSPSETPAMLRA